MPAMRSDMRSLAPERQGQATNAQCRNKERDINAKMRKEDGQTKKKDEKLTDDNEQFDDRCQFLLAVLLVSDLIKPFLGKLKQPPEYSQHNDDFDNESEVSEYAFELGVDKE